MPPPATPRVRPTYKPCVANDRHRSTLRVAVCVPGFVEVTGYGYGYGYGGDADA